MKLYLKYFLMQLKIALEYKKTFFLACLGQIITSVFSFIAIILLFDKFGSVNGFTFNEVLICFSMSFLGFSLSECIFRGFDHFDKLLSNGTFERILVSPRNLILQVLGNEIAFNKFGRTIIAIIVFIGVISSNHELLQIYKILTLILMIIGTIIIYSNLFILKAGICFFTVQGLEIMNIFTDGGKEITQYPLSIYGKWILRFFTYIVPLSLVNYYPLLYLTGRADNIFYAFCPVIVILFTIPCYYIWKMGLKKYKSIGS